MLDHWSWCRTGAVGDEDVHSFTRVGAASAAAGEVAAILVTGPGAAQSAQVLESRIRSLEQALHSQQRVRSTHTVVTKSITLLIPGNKTGNQ